MMTQSGTSQSNCCTISIATVFWPSSARGCSSSWRGRRPPRRRAAARSPCSRRSRCRATSTSAPLASGCTSCAVETLPRGRITIAGMPAAAAYAASAAEVSPVEAQATARIGLPSAIICLHRRDQHGHAEVLERAGVRVAALLDPQIVEAELAAEALGPEQVGAALVHRDDVLVARRRGRPTPSCPTRRSRRARWCACSGRRTAASTRRPAAVAERLDVVRRPRADRRRSGSDRAAARCGVRPGIRPCTGRSRGSGAPWRS